ncbi:MAG: hypothetical protein OK438_01105 [Thaumarchaeota archaeon]|nr:hypothetical protein [Nitrososphaerota archaeon]
MGKYPRLEAWAHRFSTREEAEHDARSSKFGTDKSGFLLPQIQLTLNEIFGTESRITNEDKQALQVGVGIEKAMAKQTEVMNQMETRERARARTELSEVAEELRAQLKREGLKPAMDQVKEWDFTRAVLAARVHEAVKRGGKERTRVVLEALQKQGFADFSSGSRVKLSKRGVVYYFKPRHRGRSRSPRWVRVVQRAVKRGEAARRRISQ